MNEVGERRSPSLPSVVISASLAYDRIMTFPGSFKDHILPDKAHVLSVSFLLDSLRQQRGGVAGNIAYNLALLGEPPAVASAVGNDFAEYRATFERLGIDLTHVLDVADEPTASAFLMTDLDDNQIVAFYPGAMAHAAEVSVQDVAARARWGLVGATMPDAMRKHAAEFAVSGCPYIYDPSQQVVALPAEDLLAGIDPAAALIGNDYEFAMIAQKTGLGIDALAARVPLLAVTYGEQGSELRSKGRAVTIPAVAPTTLADPTGAGDAYRAGFLKGLLLDMDLEITGRMAALAATYAIECHGTQEHSYTADEFVARFDAAFPGYAGALTERAISRQPSVVSASPHPVAGEKRYLASSG